MTAVILVSGLIGIIVLLVMVLTGEPTNNKRQDDEHRLINQVTQNALDDIRRRREYAEDQLRRLSRWQQ